MLPPPFRAMDPADDIGWLAVADWLEENDDPRRAELLRLTRLLCHDLTHPDRPAREARQMELLAAGVGPCAATMTNGIGMEFVYVPAGVFLMGSPPEEDGHKDDEGPVHEVEITRGFWMGKYPVTQAEYRAVTGTNPSHFSADGEGKRVVRNLDTSRFPVESVSYEDALSFCRELSRRVEEKRQMRTCRLPTEAEWEYSCRCGPISKPYYFGDTLSEGQANFGCRLKRTSRIDLFPTNAFGLHDMHGNVWEWCRDWFDRKSYQEGDIKDPQGPQSGTSRVQRGGSWFHGPVICRAASRSRNDPTSRYSNFGFRVCFS